MVKHIAASYWELQAKGYVFSPLGFPGRNWKFSNTGASAPEKRQVFLTPLINKDIDG